ncbi:MAG TPA: DMT family transporter, partial [Pyrinomonadaceae bacterium]|nr:DMT family transporter [Pyrinomonadaceae bacterium]
IPVFGLIAARIYLPQEKITFRKLLGILLGLFGLAVIFLEQLSIDNYAALAGSFAIVVGAFAAAFSSVLVKAKGKPIDPAATLFTQMLIGLIPIVIYSLLFEGLPSFDKFTFPVIFSLLYLSVVGTIGAFWLYYWLLRQVESTKAMMISLVTPFIAVIFGAIFLDEQLNLQSMLGGLLIISSIGLIIFNRTKLNPTNA